LLSSKATVEPAFKVNDPVTRLSMLLPAARVPPLCTVTKPPTLPLPRKVPPIAMVASPEIEPFTATIPALTLVGPVQALFPARTKVEVALFCVTLVTFAPMTVPMVVSPVAVPCSVRLPV
jgi:hypothetical protein